MFDFKGTEHADSKCYFSHGTMGHLDPKQPPTKRAPFSAILDIPFVHKTELLLPAELYELVKDDLHSKFSGIAYSRVILPLSALVEGEFFNEYIKKGNVLMLSEGQHGIDNVYSLRDGILRLSLDKESYERAGLVGQPEGVKGKRGTRSRWIVEINLRLPSMLRGKKGFDRIVYGFRNALTTPVTWLFTNLTNEYPSPDPLDKHHPVPLSCLPDVSEPLQLEIPNLIPPQRPEPDHEILLHEFAADIYEWCSLVSLESPRVVAGDSVDPFLSRYTIPASIDVTPRHVVKICWTGFMSSLMAHKIFVSTLEKAHSKNWFSCSVSSFRDNLADTKDCTIMVLQGNEYFSWEVDQR